MSRAGTACCWCSTKCYRPFAWGRAAQEYLGVTPDLCTLGKAVGGGYPLSVFGGRREIMRTADARRAIANIAAPTTAIRFPSRRPSRR